MPLAGWKKPQTDLWYSAFAIMHFECQQDGCEVWRHDAIDRNWNVIARKYDYPDWYKMTDDDRPSREQIRRWMYQALVKDDEKPERQVKKAAAKKAPAKRPARKVLSNAALKRKAG